MESIRLNATHGKQLTSMEKKRHAQNLYKMKVDPERIINILSISQDTFYKATADIRKEEKTDRDVKILQMYLSCYTEEEIAREVGMDQSGVHRAIESIMKNSEIIKSHNESPSSLQITTLWSFDACDPSYGEKGYPGRMPGQIVENLLWYYTEPFDLVLDIFAGSGTTIDVSKKMYRRYLGFDLNPNETKGIKFWITSE